MFSFDGGKHFHSVDDLDAVQVAAVAAWISKNGDDDAVHLASLEAVQGGARDGGRPFLKGFSKAYGPCTVSYQWTW